LIKQEKSGIVINLSSVEYFRAVKSDLLKADVITPIFKEYKAPDYRVVAIYAKKARGLMCDYIIRNQISRIEEVSTLNQFRKAAIIIILSILFVPQAARCADRPCRQNHKWLYEIRAGILAHDVPIWSLSRKEGGVDFNAEFIFAYPDYGLLSGILRTNLGFSLNSRGDTSKIYSGLLWEYVWNSGIFLDLGLGLAVHDGKLDNSNDRKELGSRILFRIPLEIGLLFAGHHGISIMFGHVSNAYLADPNEGLDTLGLRYSYRF
jgi:hypothetical protein